MKTIQKFLLYLLSFLAPAIIIGTGCKKNEAPVYKIGVSQCSGGEWRDKMNREMAREMLFHEDSELEIRTANDNNDKQIEDIEYFINNDFDIIIVAPNEADAITNVVKKAYDAGIPVIIFDRRVRGDSYTAYIDLDNFDIGKAAAEYAHSLLGDGKESAVIEISGLSGSTPAEERHEGFTKGLKDFPSLKLIASESGNWDHDKAYHVMDSLLDAYPEVKLVYAHNDFMALGVDALLHEKGRDDVYVLGTDASPGQGLEAIRDGHITASFIYPTEGHRIIRTAFDILEGKPYEKIVKIPALTSVDKWNAEILMRQYELLNDETQKVMLLNEKNNELWGRYKEQSAFLYTVIGLSIALLIFLGVLVFILVRNIALQRELKEKNRILMDERDRQIALYSKLEVAIQEGKHIDSDFYNKFINIVKSQYTNPDLNTEGMASQLNLGSAQLTRKIKALTNYSPVEILRNHRLEEARRLLLDTDKSINEITFAVGFSSPAYLTKCFREHFGQTPSDLRSAKTN